MFLMFQSRHISFEKKHTIIMYFFKRIIYSTQKNNVWKNNIFTK